MSEITAQDADVQRAIDQAETLIDMVTGGAGPAGCPANVQVTLAIVYAQLAQAKATAAVADRMILLADTLTELPGKLAGELCADGWITAIDSLTDEVGELIDAIGTKK